MIQVKWPEIYFLKIYDKGTRGQAGRGGLVAVT